MCIEESRVSDLQSLAIHTYDTHSHTLRWSSDMVHDVYGMSGATGLWVVGIDKAKTPSTRHRIQCTVHGNGVFLIMNYIVLEYLY